MFDLTLKCDVLSLTITSKLTQERCQAQPVQLLDVTSSQLTSQMQLKGLPCLQSTQRPTTTQRPRPPNLKKSVAQRLPVVAQVKTGNILSKDGQTTKLPQTFMGVTSKCNCLNAAMSPCEETFTEVTKLLVQRVKPQSFQPSKD